MPNQQGYYSLLQYCPDRERAEGVNVGVIMVGPALGPVRVRLIETIDHLRRRLDMPAIDKTRVLRAMNALQRRVEALGPDCDMDELLAFIAAEAGPLVLTPPRSMSVGSPQGDIDELFEALVRPRTPTANYAHVEPIETRDTPSQPLPSKARSLFLMAEPRWVRGSEEPLNALPEQPVQFVGSAPPNMRSN